MHCDVRHEREFLRESREREKKIFMRELHVLVGKKTDVDYPPKR